MKPIEQALFADAEEIFRSALAAVNPHDVISRHLVCKKGGVFFENERLGATPVYLLAFGKAAAPMAAAICEVCGADLKAGIVIMPAAAGGVGLPDKIRVFQAGHPFPEKENLLATQEVLHFASRLPEGATVIVALSGGASALLVSPVAPITLEDKRSVSKLLLASGARISEINTVRKVLSRVKGGKLAALLHRCRILNLIVSDVIGDDPATIGSGPTVLSPVSKEEALAVCADYGILEALPPRVRKLLQQPGDKPQLHTQGKPVIHTKIIANNAMALAAACRSAEKAGYRPLILSTGMQGEARHVGRLLAAIARDSRSHGWPLAPPCCIIAGGETTVTVRGAGQGGRNQEVALAAVPGLDGLGSTGLLASGSDGIDGPTDAAGAFVSSFTAQKAEARGLSWRRALRENDSYAFFAGLGQLFKPGPTGTNVMDIHVLLIKE